MNIELTWQLKKLLGHGIYHFDFITINQKTNKLDTVGYIVVNTRKDTYSLNIANSISQNITENYMQKVINNVLKAAIALNNTIY